jgi:hypothetical protein
VIDDSYGTETNVMRVDSTGSLLSHINDEDNTVSAFNPVVGDNRGARKVSFILFMDLHILCVCVCVCWFPVLYVFDLNN